MPVRPRKTLYYLRSLAALARLAEPRSLAVFLARRGGTIRLRNGLTFRLGGLLDLLTLKETVVDDSYRLRELDGTAPATIVDVGASAGDFAVWCASRFPAATVIAFEPNPASFELLEQNVRANGLTNVAAHRAAVGVRPEYELRNPRAGPLGSALEPATAAAITVPAVRLDAAVEHERVDLLKIDCEGLELAVLESASGLLPRVQRIALEYHRHLVPDADRLCLQLLAAHGFEASSIADRYDPAIGYIYARRA